MTERLLEIARFTLREGRCGLCGSDALTPLPTGFRCECGAISLTPTRPNPYASRELAEHRREDEAALSDYLAAEGVGRHRGFGG